jgi:hypothetical protein
MPDVNPAIPQHLFIVRIWRESSQAVAQQWHGSVEHVPSGQRLYFSSLGDLNDFITWRLNSPPSQEVGQ